MSRCSTLAHPTPGNIRRSIRLILLFAAFVFGAALHAQPPQILVQSPSVQSPVGRENWVIDSTYTIRWFTSGDMGDVSGVYEIHLSRDSGSTWSLIGTATARKGSDSLRWRVTGDTTHRALIRVRTTDSVVSGRSRWLFSIVDRPVLVLFITAPNGGETFNPGSQTMIRWVSQYVRGDLAVEYSLDSGAEWKTIQRVPARDGFDSLAWTLPTDSTRRALVRVRALDGTIEDASNWIFSIVVIIPPVVKIISPNGGEALPADSLTVIYWETRNALPGWVGMQYSIDSGRIWVNVAPLRPVRNGRDSMFWKVPKIVADAVRLKVVVASGNPSLFASDTSDSDFSITGTPAPSISLVSLPTGGRYIADSVISIRWASARVEGDIAIEYSTDNRATWKKIAIRHAESGADSIRWVIPNEPTPAAWVRVRTVDSTVIATCARPFTILARGTTGVAEKSMGITSAGIYPNPVRGAAELHWTQTAGAVVRIRITAADGRLVADLDAGRREPGMQRMMLDLEQTAAGRYFVEIISGNTRIARTDLVR